MTFIGRATRAMFNTIADETYDRVFEWFKKHPEAQFAYWAKDEFLSDKATDEERKDFVARHKEIDDLNDHTTVIILNDTVILQTFCPRLKAGIKELFEDGIITGTCEKTQYFIEKDESNFRILLGKK